LTFVVIFDNIESMIRTRPVQWIKTARKEFETFPQGAQIELGRALTVVAEGGHPDIAKPLKGFGSGVLELALRFHGDAYRVVYALRLGGDAVWVVHAFQKKSKTGIKTPKAEIDLIHERLKRLKEMLR
jgi:phage-related protein